MKFDASSPQAGSRRDREPTPPPLPSARKLAEDVREDLWFGDDDPERTHLDASRSMASASALAVGLKPFPAVARHVATLLSDPEVRIHTVRDAVEKDTALASRLMRMANSVAFRPASAITSIEQAIVRLGARTVRDIVSGIATLGMFDDVTGIGSLMRDHCAGVAAIVRVLGVEWRYGGVGDAFLCALMHDVGKLLSLQVGEIDYAKFDPWALASPDEVHVLERVLSGYDHAVLGAHVLSAWGFPKPITQVVALHHQPGRAYMEGGDVGLSVALVRLADAIEYKLRVETALDDAFVEDLARGGACSYLDFSSDVLCAMWPKFIAAHEELLSVITT